MLLWSGTAFMGGRIKSVRDARMAYGITRGVSQRFFKLLNRRPRGLKRCWRGCID